MFKSLLFLKKFLSSLKSKIKEKIYYEYKPKKTVLKLKENELVRMPYFYELIKQIKNVDGSIVECGVGWGKTLTMIATSLRMNNDKDRKIYGFDSFMGFPEPVSSDLPGKARKGHYATSYKYVKKFLYEYLEKKNSIELVKGYIENTLPEFNEKIAFLHIDLDLYNSYKITLEELYPLVQKNGIIAFDEYQSEIKWPGAKKAIDEFLLITGENLIHSEIINRYYLVKSKD